jgi:hypothetical protein
MLEVTIPGTSTDRIKTTLVGEMQKRKFRIANDTRSEMSFEQPASSAVSNHVFEEKAYRTVTIILAPSPAIIPALEPPSRETYREIALIAEAERLFNR